MPKYIKGEEKKYFPTVIAILIILATAIGFFIYSIVTGPIDKSLKEVLVDDDGIINIQLNPGPDLAQPKIEPNIEQPTTPPPGK